MPQHSYLADLVMRRKLTQDLKGLSAQLLDAFLLNSLGSPDMPASDSPRSWSDSDLLFLRWLVAERRDTQSPIQLTLELPLCWDLSPHALNLFFLKHMELVRWNPTHQMKASGYIITCIDDKSTMSRSLREMEIVRCWVLGARYTELRCIRDCV